jgi:hypothetical protein
MFISDLDYLDSITHKVVGGAPLPLLLPVLVVPGVTPLIVGTTIVSPLLGGIAKSQSVTALTLGDGTATATSTVQGSSNEPPTTIVAVSPGPLG